MRPSEALRNRLGAVRAAIARSPFENPHVFGAVARGEDNDNSDLDLLAEPRDGASYFDAARVQDGLETLLGVEVDLVPGGSLKPLVARTVLQGLRPLRGRRVTPAGRTSFSCATSSSGRRGSNATCAA